MSEKKGAAPRADTSWLHDAGWGVFTHYLAGLASARDAPDLTPDERSYRAPCIVSIAAARFSRAAASAVTSSVYG